ncbi:MAG TPA: cellulase family glycosylhydrolase [Fibrobacteria bacterium]|nr:cellulase family glycosylhydrolase [Fibrobacteria bacterium]
MAFGTTSAVQAANVWAVDDKGNITLNGQIYRLRGGSWFGLEGRHEPSNDATNPSGAPMEMYLGNMFWSESGRTLAQDAKDIKALGFNSIRLPLSPQTLSDSDPQGKDPNLKNAPAVRIQGAFTALKETIKACNTAGLYVMLDLHSCSNFVGWRKGRLDARPPYADANRVGYDYKREEYSCSETGNPSTVKYIHAYNTTKWLADLKKLAGLGAEIGVDNIIGIDIFNEPWDYTWSEWRSLIDQAYAAISSVNPNILIFAQGVGSTHGSQDGSPETKEKTPHGDTASNPNWGENLFDAGRQPPTMPKSKLVFSPHTYGPAVFQQAIFADPSQPECIGLEGEAFAAKKCQLVINQTQVDRGWNEHFGYLRALGYAVIPGEFGGNMDWPNKTDTHTKNLWAYLTDKAIDQKWQEAFVDYMMREGIYDSFYWSINPESADTYGIFTSPYDPVSNNSGWGTWSNVDERKMSLLNKLWNAPPVAEPGKAASIQGTAKHQFNLRVSSMGLISYSLPKAEFVSLKLYNMDGKLVSEVIGKQQAAGFYSVTRRQMQAEPGVYLAVFKAGGHSYHQTLTLTN